MSYYNICPDCGASLDPGEKCDCQTTENLRKRAIALVMRMTDEQCEEVLRALDEYEKAAQGVTSTPDGKVEQNCKPDSTSIITDIQEDVKYE